MGSSNSVCINISLNRPNTFFFAGERVSGTVNVDIKEDQAKVDEIYILLLGETGYTTTRTVTDGNGSSRTETDYHDVRFLTEKISFDSPESRGTQMTYRVGHYSWQFDMELPRHLPPTINDHKKYPHVRYYLNFVIDKAWYKRNPREILPFIVFPHINLSLDSQPALPSVFSNHNRKDVTLTAKLDKLGYLPGEIMTGTMEIRNPKRILLKEVHATLHQHSKIERNTKKENIFQIVLPAIQHSKSDYISDRIAFTIPQTYLAPSYEFHSGYSRTANAEVFYTLDFSVKAEGMFTNFDTSVPIKIGTECDTKGTASNHEYPSNDLYPNSVSYYPQLDHMEELPPPYSAT